MRNRELDSCDALTVLDLSSNGFGVEGLAHLQIPLKTCDKLTFLDLQDNAMGDDGVLAIDISNPADPQVREGMAAGTAYTVLGGDYMGMAGKLNDNSHIPSDVRSFLPNDYGLYNMGGNVSEWTADLYRPMTSEDLRDVDNHDLNPYRGNRFQTLELDEDGRPVEKDSLGRLRYRDVEDDEAATRDNYKRGEVHNYMDGDKESEAFYEYGVTTLISDKSRVYKGGSWSDRAYWMSPGTRRFMEEDKSSRTIGFRCAMTYLGRSSGSEF